MTKQKHQWSINTYQLIDKGFWRNIVKNGVLKPWYKQAIMTSRIRIQDGSWISEIESEKERNWPAVWSSSRSISLRNSASSFRSSVGIGFPSAESESKHLNRTKILRDWGSWGLEIIRYLEELPWSCASSRRADAPFLPSSSCRDILASALRFYAASSLARSLLDQIP